MINRTSKLTSNGTVTSNSSTITKTNGPSPDDENWKLLKFLCDRIEENKKKEAKQQRQQSKQSTDNKNHNNHKNLPHSPKPIPITTNILAKRKKKKKNKTYYSNSNNSTTSSPTSSVSSNNSNHNLLSISPNNHTLNTHHSKTKSQALYTSAIKQNSLTSLNSSITNSSNSSIPPSLSPKLEHQKSRSTQLPHKYIHHQHIFSVSHPPEAPPTIPIASLNLNIVQEREQEQEQQEQQQQKKEQQISNGNYNHTLLRQTQENPQSPLSDPVSSLVSLVRRVTEKYSNMNDDQQIISDQETIKQVYDKYLEFYHRPPVYPDHLRKFANKLNLNVTFKAAKIFLDNIRAIQIATTEEDQKNNEKNKSFTQRLTKKSRTSISSPVLPSSSPLTKIISADSFDVDDDDEEDELSPFAFYNLNNLELLQNIKKKINQALRDSDDIESVIHMIWEREYHELEKRLHRENLNKIKLSFPNQHQLLKRDRTFLSLKHMSESTDVDDGDHDAAVFLLKNYFHDDDDDYDDNTSFYNDYDDYHSQIALAANSKNNNNKNKNNGNKNKNNHIKSSKSSIPKDANLNIKPQQQHIRSVTADKERKPQLYRRSTSKHAEALSLYDTMVMKARKNKIKSKKLKTRTFNIAQLKQNKSAPTSRPSIKNNDDNKEKDDQSVIIDEFAEEDDDNNDNNMADTDNQSVQYKLEDEDMIIGSNEMSPDPPLFDAAFRQLTTNLIPMDTSIDISTTSISKQSTGNKSNDLSVTQPMDIISPTTTATEIPRDLLSIMSKYGEKMENWDFDIFEMMDDPLLCNKGLTFSTFFLFRKIGLLEATGVLQGNLWRFLENVEIGYKLNPYHNRYHAVDVLLSTHFMFQSSLMKKNMTMWDTFATYIAAVCHDLGHMGYNNAWYINTAGNLALLYGDESVLENYHIAETFRILNNSKNNWMSSFPSSIRRYLATVIRRTILATDLKVHGTKMIQLQNMANVYKKIQDKNKIKLWRCQSIENYASLDNIMLDGFKLFIDDELNESWTGDIVIKDADDGDNNNNNDNDDDKDNDYDDDESPKKPRILGIDDERLFLLEITIHCCDVANPCKPLYLAKQWANRFLLEAFNQGDQERNIGIPVSAGMDRFTTKLPTSQIGFITFVVKRLFELYAQIISESQNCVDIMLKNEQYWIQEKKKLINNKTPQQPSLQTINE